MRRTYEQNIKTIVMVSQFMVLYSFWVRYYFFYWSFTICVPPLICIHTMSELKLQKFEPSYCETKTCLKLVIHKDKVIPTCMTKTICQKSKSFFNSTR